MLLIAWEETESLPGAIYRVLDSLISDLGTRSFNVAILQPPLAESPEDWSGFPLMARIVDRGDPMKRTNDVGSMEMYASPVIPTDPFRLVEALQAKRLAGAALDVFEFEPLPMVSPLMNMDNVLLAPHNSNSSPARSWIKPCPTRVALTTLP